MSDGGGNGRFANRPYQMVVRGNEGWVPASARTTEGRGSDGSRRDVMAGGTGGSRTAPTRWLSEGMRDGSPHPRGQRRGGGAMGEARRDGGGNGRFANRPYQMVVRGNEGWVPASARTTGGRGSDGSRRDVMAGGTGGSRTARSRWLSEGMRDGSPHPRGQRRGGGAMGEARRDGGGNGRFANRPYQMVVRGNEGWVPASARTRGKGG